MCTHAIWIHCKVNAHFHPRDVEESGESSILQHGLESIYSIPCMQNPSRACICVPVDLLHVLSITGTEKMHIIAQIVSDLLKALEVELKLL